MESRNLKKLIRLHGSCHNHNTVSQEVYAVGIYMCFILFCLFFFYLKWPPQKNKSILNNISAFFPVSVLSFFLQVTKMKMKHMIYIHLSSYCLTWMGNFGSSFEDLHHWTISVSLCITLECIFVSSSPPFKELLWHGTT